MSKKEYDAVVVGSGPNGLAAAITLQRAGISVLLIEAKQTIGGGLRTAELTLPGFRHDVCSAIHPLAAASPFFNSVDLQKFGVEFIQPRIAAAHPFDDGSAAVITRSIEETAELLGEDGQAYLDLVSPIVRDWPMLIDEILGPLHFPKHTLPMAKFGMKALGSALHLSKKFKGKKAKGLWGGMAAHSIQPLSNLTTSAIGLILMASAHTVGWPIPKGGSQAIADALAAYFISMGGKIETGLYVKSLKDIPSSDAVLFDVTPIQLLEIAGHQFTSLYRWQLEKYRYGMGVFKIDWALDAPVPFTAKECREAGTVHIGNTLEEIAGTEQITWEGHHHQRPFVLFAQQSVFDDSRAPLGKHVGWAYCHVPNGSTIDMTEVIEKQIERFAPGFRERILAKNVMNTEQLEEYNPNYIGGDINGGVIDAGQLFARPALRPSPYRTTSKGIYICSSSTPPGGGVHGMCGYHAAKRALKDVFKVSLEKEVKGQD